MPSRWGPFSIKKTNVSILSQCSMHMNGEGSAPGNAPAVIDAHLGGGPGAMWAMSVLADVTLPSSAVWGEFASFATIDAPAMRTYYGRGGDHGSILGNSSTDFLWADRTDTPSCGRTARTTPNTARCAPVPWRPC
ncbi:hypothetical protein [Streptomyces sp. NPDC127119]|uniref:hypothetical protein n=1 Tax=Streptomyces sp. NPDC127119 TaxID=3345370 RepID=UPI003638F6EA